MLAPVVALLSTSAMMILGYVVLKKLLGKIASTIRKVIYTKDPKQAIKPKMERDNKNNYSNATNDNIDQTDSRAVEKESSQKSNTFTFGENKEEVGVIEEEINKIVAINETKEDENKAKQAVPSAKAEVSEVEIIKNEEGTIKTEKPLKRDMNEEAKHICCKENQEVIAKLDLLERKIKTLNMEHLDMKSSILQLQEITAKWKKTRKTLESCRLPEAQITPLQEESYLEISPVEAGLQRKWWRWK